MRNIFTVNAVQVVISDSHPEGLFSVIDGYPKYFDTRRYNSTETNPNGDEEAALNAAKSEYYGRLSSNYAGSPSRVMSTVTLSQADGKVILRERVGTIPDMTPAIEEIPE